MILIKLPLFLSGSNAEKKLGQLSDKQSNIFILTNHLLTPIQVVHHVDPSALGLLNVCFWDLCILKPPQTPMELYSTKVSSLLGLRLRLSCSHSSDCSVLKTYQS